MSTETETFDDDVISQLATVRHEGYCNMVDRGCVRDAADQIGFDALVGFIDSADSGEYMDALEYVGDNDPLRE